MVTHGHVDHAGCCIHHARGRSLTSAPATYYIPKSIEAPLLKAKSAFEEMDGKKIPMNIVSVSPNDSVMLTKNLKAVVFETEHRVASQGYALYSVNKGSILPEYQHLSHKEISIMAKEGKKFLSDPIERLELIYTGDTTFAGLMKPQNAFIFQSPLFITELTYLDGDYEKAMQWNHIHIQDIINFQDLFDTVGKIVFVHISQKYSFNRAIELMRTQLPLGILAKASAALASFDSKEILTDLQDSLLRSEGSSSSSSSTGHSSSRWRDAQRQPGWGWTKKHYDGTNNNGRNNNNINNNNNHRREPFRHERGGNKNSSGPSRQTRQYSTHPYAHPKHTSVFAAINRTVEVTNAEPIDAVLPNQKQAREVTTSTFRQYEESFSIQNSSLPNNTKI